jgi:hypothetical protein
MHYFYEAAFGFMCMHAAFVPVPRGGACYNGRKLMFLPANAGLNGRPGLSGISDAGADQKRR